MKKKISDLKPGDTALVIQERLRSGDCYLFKKVQAVTKQHGGTIVLKDGGRYDLNGRERGANRSFVTTFRLAEDQSEKAHERARQAQQKELLASKLRSVNWGGLPYETLKAVVALVKEAEAQR